MHKKKAQIEIQFNWIFVLIAGALILVFFSAIIVKQKQISDTKLSINILTDLQTLTVGAEVSSNVYNNFSSRGNVLEFSCQDCSCFYALDNILGSTDIAYNARALFAPSLIDANRIIVFSLDWNMPFKITNFLYLTSDKMRYVINKDSANNVLLSKIQKALHGGMLQERIDSPDDYINRNEKKVRFVFFGKDKSYIESSDLVGDGVSQGFNTKKMDNKDITAINIIPRTLEVGTVEFYRKNPSSSLDEFELVESYPYLGIPSLVGAIIVDDFELYKCPMDDAFTRLNYVSKVYFNRMGALKDYYTLPSNADAKCTTRYTSAESKLDNIITTSDKPFGSFIDSNPLSDLGSMHTSAFDENTGLAQTNNRLQLFSCPEIY